MEEWRKEEENQKLVDQKKKKKKKSQNIKDWLMKCNMSRSKSTRGTRIITKIATVTRSIPNKDAWCRFGWKFILSSITKKRIIQTPKGTKNRVIRSSAKKNLIRIREMKNWCRKPVYKKRGCGKSIIPKNALVDERETTKHVLPQIDICSCAQPPHFVRGV